MAEKIVEVLENGFIHCYDIDKCVNIADDLLIQLEEKEGVELEFDYVTSVYGLFIRTIHILRENGYETNELVNTVLDHSTFDIDDLN